MSYTSRPAVAADAEAISALVNSAYRGESSRAGWTTEADFLDGTRTDAAAVQDIINTPHHTIFVTFDGPALIGCVEVRHEHDKLYFGMLSVKPTLQNKGIGKIMLLGVEDEARRRNCTSLYMNVLSERRELIEWYERNGYYDTGARKPFMFNDPRFGTPRKPLEFIVMEKKLM